MGCLASRQVQQGLCVNFVQVFGIFYGEAHPDELIWGSIENKAPQGTNPKPAEVADYKGKRAGKRKPSKKKVAQDTHLYIAMELCDRGCVEDVLRVLEASVLAAEASGLADPGLHLVVPYMFQMCMSLAVTSAHLHMLHADVKLLNFMMRVNTDGSLRYARALHCIASQG